MNGSDNEKILHLRNTISLCVDDLTALVVNSALADSLREFSSEVMELTPGFAFGLKQARKLKDETLLTLRQYQARAISDGDLMNYIANAHKIIKDETQSDGGIQMVLKNLFQGKERKKQENIENLQREYREVCDQILGCEEKMTQCVEASRGHSPDSMVYRENERAYMNAKNQLSLLKKQEAMLSETLSNVARIDMIEQFKQRQKRFSQYSQNVIGSEKARDHTLAEAEMLTEKINSVNEKVQGYGASLFEDTAEAAPRSNSEFGALVASSERRQSILEGEGGFAEAAKAAEPVQKSEFDRLVSESRTEE